MKMACWSQASESLSASLDDRTSQCARAEAAAASASGELSAKVAEIAEIEAVRARLEAEVRRDGSDACVMNP